MQLRQKWIGYTETLLLGMMGILAATFIAFYGYVAWYTIPYPFFLDWPDGNLLVPVLRILDGHPLYSRPTTEYVPNLYMPLFFYVSAFLSLFVGRGFLALRLVSFFAVTGIGILTYLWIRREGGSRIVAFGTAGLFFATFKICGYWFNVGRPDCLFFSLLLSGVYISLYHRATKSMVLAGLLFTLAFFTKQSALVAILPLLFCGMLIDHKRWRIISAWFIGPSIFLLLLLHYWSGGWFTFFVFTMPSHHPVESENIVNFWKIDLWKQMWPCCVLTICAGILNFSKGWRYGLFFLTLCVGCIALSYISRLHVGGYINVLIPAFYVLILSSALHVIHMRQWTCSFSFGWTKTSLYFLSLLLLITQYAMLLYDPRHIIPGGEEWTMSSQFTDYLRHIDGDVLISKYPVLQIYAGKKSYGWGSAGWDILRMTNASKVRDDFVRDVNMSLREGKFAALFLAEDEEERDYLNLEGMYCYKETIPSGVRVNPLEHGRGEVKVFTRCTIH